MSTGPDSAVERRRPERYGTGFRPVRFLEADSGRMQPGSLDIRGARRAEAEGVFGAKGKLERGNVLGQLFLSAPCDDGKHGRFALTHPGYDHLAGAAPEFCRNCPQHPETIIRVRSSKLGREFAVAARVCSLEKN